MNKLFTVAAFLIISAAGGLFAASGSLPWPDDPVLEAMKDEMDRSLSELKVEDFGPPYFMCFTVIEWENYTLVSRYGALYYENQNSKNSLDSEVRVGDYEFDSSVHNYQDLYSPTDYMLGGQSSDAPLDYNSDAIRRGLWLLTDSAYKSAIARYQNKKIKRAVGAPQGETLPDLTREKPLAYEEDVPELKIDRAKWIRILNEESAYLASFDRFLNSGITLSVVRYNQRQINSEKSAAIIGGITFSITASYTSIAEDGTPLFDIAQIKGRSLDKLPTREQLHKKLVELVEGSEILLAAEELPPYTGPAILSPEVSGVLFHEAIGHRLEGIRQRNEDEGQTFADEMGRQILPSFLSVIDDPTAEAFGSQELFGYYPVDDQLVRSQKVVLVENGILRNFLLSRRPVKGFTNSNGHGRGGGPLGPIGRMSNLFIKSTNEKSAEELKKMLIAEAKKQGKPFGVIIQRVVGGETNTKRQGFFGEGQAQMFRVPVILAYKVNVETGEETPIRGIDMIGTPLVSINKIVATGNDYQAENGYCGAESGMQPVSQIAPSILTTEIELQRSGSKKQSKPLLPAP
jgi:TldD protein